ncbi:MAG: NADH:ubiquinone oxidoreductase subunit F (NADH-binding) [Saprospiraceae bacterium]|jgi:NADH:ubiquinone oxidoreductase subunit F (NADH-binding)
MSQNNKSPETKLPRKRRQNKGRPLNPEALIQIETLLSGRELKSDLLIEYLHLVQDEYKQLSLDHLLSLAHLLRIAPVKVHEVASFYHHFDVAQDGDQPADITVRVCDSISCEMAGAESLIDSLKQTYKEPNIRIQRVPCIGRCAEAPVAVVGQNPVNHATVESITTHVSAGNTAAATIPSTMESYLAEGGYSTITKLLAGEQSVEDVIETLKTANLRGLGGAGFPLATKWNILRSQATPRWMAINIDEGEPGTFKDRVYLEKQPHALLEGILIAGWAIESSNCILYVRDEYPAIITALNTAIEELQQWATFDLPTFEVRRGAGAYICGEESAMIESIEGKRAYPRQRPPYIAEVGLYGQPTLEHNCETLYWVPKLLRDGPEFFADEGRRDRVGLRSFSISGRVNNPGVHFAPAGISMRELIEEYCGGMQEGHELYGYLPGGASGGILPASLADEPMDFDTLQKHGCFIGSAAVIVFSQHDKARDIAKNAMSFFAHESCGQCTPCRVGTQKASQLMNAPKWDVDLLESLCTTMEDASICGLGQAAPNPLRSVVRFFPEEIS